MTVRSIRVLEDPTHLIDSIYMSNVWEKFEDFGNQASAEALAGRLRVDGVPVRIERISPLPGLDEGYRVMVPRGLAHRAQRSLGSLDTPEPESEENLAFHLMTVVFYGGALGFLLATLGLLFAADSLEFDWGLGNPIINALVGFLLGFPVAGLFLYVYSRRSSRRR